MKKVKKKITSIITSLLMTGSCSISKAFDNDSFEEYSEDYQDPDEEDELDDGEDNENAQLIEEKDNLTKAYNLVLNHPYTSLGFIGLLGYTTLKLARGVYDAVKDNGQTDLQNYANTIIDSVKQTDAATKDIPNENLFSYQKIKLMQEVSKIITANMFRSVLPFCNILTSNSNGAKATAKGIKDVIYSGVRCKNKGDLLSHLVSKWNLSKEWACYQCALVLKVVADQLGLPNCVCKDKENHVTLLLPIHSPYLYLNGQYESTSAEMKYVLRYGGEVNDCFGKPKGVEGKLLYGLNNGDILFTSSGKVYEVLEKQWKKVNENKDGTFYLENGWEKKAYNDVKNIIDGNVNGKTFLKEINPKRNSYNNLLHNLCMYDKAGVN